MSPCSPRQAGPEGQDRPGGVSGGREQRGLVHGRRQQWEEPDLQPPPAPGSRVKSAPKPGPGAPGATRGGKRLSRPWGRAGLRLLGAGGDGGGCSPARAGRGATGSRGCAVETVRGGGGAASRSSKRGRARLGQAPASLRGRQEGTRRTGFWSAGEIPMTYISSLSYTSEKWNDMEYLMKYLNYGVTTVVVASILAFCLTPVMVLFCKCFSLLYITIYHRSSKLKTNCSDDFWHDARQTLAYFWDLYARIWYDKDCTPEFDTKTPTNTRKHVEGFIGMFR